MGRIRVYRPEAGGKHFPRMCMRCGQPAEVDVQQTFIWMPGWVSILILAGLAPWIIVGLLLRRTMRVVVPMCHRHAGHWWKRKLFVWLGLVFWIVFGIALVTFSDRIPKDSMGPVILSAFAGMLMWFLIAGLLMNNAIRAAEINDKRVDLVNVNRDFADEWSVIADEIRPAPRRRGRTSERDRPW